MEPTTIVLIVFLIVLIVLLIGILIFKAARYRRRNSAPFPVPSNQATAGLQSRNNRQSNRPVARSLLIREPVAKSKRDRYNGSKRPVARLNVNSNTSSDNNIDTRYQIDGLVSNGMKRNEAIHLVEQMRRNADIKHATMNGGGTSEFHSRT